MAFPAAAGWGNLPQGNFVPEIYSQNVLKYFRKVSVCQAITNTDYYGELQNMGDTVHIIKEPTITVSDYTRGQQLQTQILDDEGDTLTIDQSKYYQFAVDDIERKQSHVNWESMATNSGGYALRDDFDTNILAYMNGQVSSSSPDMVLNTDTATAGTLDEAAKSVDLGFASGEVSPLNLLSRLSRLLDEQNVPEENRWCVASPIFWEVMEDDNSKILSNDYTEKGILRNGRVHEGLIRRFSCYKSNNMPAATSATGIVLVGHMSSTATATNLSQSEVIRSEDFFGDKVRALHVYGRKTLRDYAMAKAFYTVD